VPATIMEDVISDLKDARRRSTVGVAK